MIKQKNKKNELLQGKISELNNDNCKIYQCLTKHYVSKNDCVKLNEQIEVIENEFRRHKNIFMPFKNYKLKKQIEKAKESVNRLEVKREDSNIQYLESLAQKLSPNILGIGDKHLDRFQILPTMVDERNILVIAGAGTGKTSTVIGRIKYLLLEKKIPENEILALTYTKSTSEDMSNRIKNEINHQMDVFTFHKLGRSIICEVEGIAPSISNVKIQEFVSKSLKELIKENKQYKNLLFIYLSYHQHLAKTLFDFKTKEEYEEYRRNHPYITLNGERVKSGEEVLIANYLFSNGIDYKYEKKYPVNTGTKEYRNYYPDFYLVKEDIWLEHFAINRNNTVPSFFTGKAGKTAQQTYIDSINWKRSTHKKYKTTLVETYSYQFSEGTIQKDLDTIFKDNNVAVNTINRDDVMSKQMADNGIMNGLVELFSTIIILAKNNNQTAIDFSKMAMDRESEYLKELILPIFVKYEQVLEENNEIDFSDMLNKAIAYLETGQIKSNYTQVIVDEFQDMTNLTYRLLRALRKSQEFNLMCVGDDWQSIYRFIGSNIDYITSFEKYFGPAEIFKIRKTYRFGQSIAEVSSSFIQKNPIQLRKELICNDPRTTFDVEILEGNNEISCVENIEKSLRDLKPGSDVLLIGRYNNDINMFKNNYRFSMKSNTKNNAIQVIYKNREDLSIVYRTAHQAKGLEYEYVYIINTKEGMFGFPSKIQDNPIISYFLSKKETFVFAEERRLFYVSLTRAKKKVWLVVNKTSKSQFIKELETMYESYIYQKLESQKDITFRIIDGRDTIVEKCPKCAGKLVKRNGSYGPFFGCLNYPDCKYTKSIKSYEL